MNRIIVFHGLTETDGDSTVYGVFMVSNNKVLQQMKADAANFMSFTDIVAKYKLKPSDGECIIVEGGP